MSSYIRRIRQKLGKDRFIHPGARIIIENSHRQILFIERVDNGQLGLPAGALEEGETIEQCIRREAREETGLILGTVHLIGLSSAPGRETVTYPNGDCIQYFTTEFYCQDYSGDINVLDQNEVRRAIFLDWKNWKRLPLNEQSAIESLIHYQAHQEVLVK